MIYFKEFNSFDEVKDLRQEWDHLVLDCSSPIYMSFDWCDTWWKYYGNKKELLIYMFYQNNNLIGILPLYCEKIGVKFFSLKVIKLVGANLPPKVFNPPLPSEHLSTVFEILLKALFNKGCDILSIGPVSDNYIEENRIRIILSNFSFEKCKIIFYDHYSYINVPKDFNEYLEMINKREKNAYKKNIKKLNRDYKIRIEFSDNFEESEFMNFRFMHSSQWLKQGKLGHFSSWPKGLDYNIALAKKLSEDGKYLLFRLLKNNEAIFYGYGYIFNNTFYFQIFGRSVSSENEKFSLGTIGHCIIMEYMINNGMNRIELGPGYFEYKLNLGAKLEKIYNLRFEAKKLSTKIKKSILSIDKQIYNLFYFKFWYRIVQPILPKKFKRHISVRWIKLDF